MQCPLLKALSDFLLETTLSDSQTLDKNVARFTCQFCTTISTTLAALWSLELAVTSFFYMTIK